MNFHDVTLDITLDIIFSQKNIKKTIRSSRLLVPLVPLWEPGFSPIPNCWISGILRCMSLGKQTENGLKRTPGWTKETMKTP
jgi:hypothetical protein